LIQEEIISKEQLLLWNEKKLKLDKASSLYFRKKEKQFKAESSDFFEWLKNEDNSSSSSSSDSE